MAFLVVDTVAESAYFCVGLEAGAGESFTHDEGVLDFSGYATTDNLDGCLLLGEGGS